MIALLRQAPAWFWVGLAVLAGFRLVLAQGVPSPIIFADEQLYTRLAFGFAHGEPFQFRGAPLNFPAILYPLLLTPTQLVPDGQLAYRLAQALNIALWGAAALPLYLLGRLWLPAAVAAAAALVATVAPYALYANLAVTESLFFLLMTIIVYTGVRALTEDGQGPKLAMAVAMGLAFFAKPHGMFLPLAVGVALALALVLRRHEAPGPWRRLIGYWPAIGLYAVFPLVHLLKTNWLTGRPPFDLAGFFGTYSGGFQAIRPFDPLAFAHANLVLLEALMLSSGFLPVVGFALFAGWAAWRGDLRDRMFVALVVLLAGLLFGITARFATMLSQAPLIYERYTFYVAPFMVLGAVLVVQRLRPPFWLLAGAGLLGVLGCGASVYLASGTPTAIDAPSFSVFWTLAQSWGLGWQGARLVGVAALAIFVSAAAICLHASRWRTSLGLFVGYGLAVTLLAYVPQAHLSQQYSGRTLTVEWVLAHSAPDRPLVVIEDHQDQYLARLVEVFTRQNFRMYYLGHSFDFYLHEKLEPSTSGELATLSALPDGSRIIAHPRVRLALPVIASKEAIVIYDKQGTVKLLPEVGW